MEPGFSNNPNRFEGGQVAQPNIEAGGYNLPPNYHAPERGFEAPMRSPEQGLGGQESFRDSSANMQASAPVLSAPQQGTPQSGSDDDVEEVRVSKLPTAEDRDVIEKEWVDKAKEIIERTPNDPRTRQLAFGALQSDYLLKRYGKRIGQGD